jgi:hypothetical protein
LNGPDGYIAINIPAWVPVLDFKGKRGEEFVKAIFQDVEKISLGSIDDRIQSFPERINRRCQYRTSSSFTPSKLMWYHRPYSCRSNNSDQSGRGRFVFPMYVENNALTSQNSPSFRSLISKMASQGEDGYEAGNSARRPLLSQK